MVFLTLHEGLLATSESPTRRLAARALVPSFLYAVALWTLLLALRGRLLREDVAQEGLWRWYHSHASMLVPVAWASGRT